MKKILPVVILGGLVVGVLALRSGDSGDTAPATTQSATSTKSSSKTEMAKQDASETSGSTETVASASTSRDAEQAEIELLEDNIKPATETYKSADEAFAAIKAGAKEYDDLVLEQFVEPDSACDWCTEFYAQVNETMLSDSISNDERSYFAEVLAISGRVDNIDTLVTAIEASSDDERKDIFAEALEMTVGDDRIVQYFGERITTEDELLKESMLAAVTNHGSRLAIDVLYQETVKNDDPDGFYSIGIGLGEIIPDDETLPYLEELANKRDKFSHLAVKALLNQGDQGLKTVMDLLEKSDNPDNDKALLEDAVDHVAYEDSTASYLEKLASSSSNPAVVEFSKAALEEIEALDEELEIEIEEVQ